VLRLFEDATAGNHAEDGHGGGADLVKATRGFNEFGVAAQFSRAGVQALAAGALFREDAGGGEREEEGDDHGEPAGEWGGHQTGAGEEDAEDRFGVPAPVGGVVPTAASAVANQGAVCPAKLGHGTLKGLMT